MIAKQNADPQAIQDCLEGMRAAAEGWEVASYAKHTGRFELVDAKDRHVAAAAYKLSLDDWPSQPVALVTQNIKDFPQRAFKDTQVVRYAMAAYLEGLHAEAPDLVAKLAEGCHRKLKAPKLTREEYVAVLMNNGCQGLAQALANRWSVECPMWRRMARCITPRRDVFGSPRQEAWQPKAVKAFAVAGWVLRSGL